MTILRKAEHKALSSIELSGQVLDLGGDKRSDYVQFFAGNFSITTANIDQKTHPDIVCDLEERLPIAGTSYDAVLLINVLEHIFEYRQLLAESHRVVKLGGKLVIIVPFLFPVHGSPHDFHRFTASALERALSLAGFTNVSVKPLGSGVFAARWLQLERLLPRPLAWLSALATPLSKLGDKLIVSVARASGKKYLASDYALGYCVEAQK